MDREKRDEWSNDKDILVSEKYTMISTVSVDIMIVWARIKKSKLQSICLFLEAEVEFWVWDHKKNKKK